MTKPIIDQEKLSALFTLKAEKLRNIPKTVKIETNQKLKFYGLYKVITNGPYSDKNKQVGGFFDFEVKYKNEAWQKCSVFSKEEAMIQYITLYNEITGEKDEEAFYLASTDSKVTIKDIDIEIPDNIDTSSLYSSNVKQYQQEMTEFLEKASNCEKAFQVLKDDIYAGDLITIEGLKQFEKDNQINLLTFKDSLGQTILHVAVDAMSISAVEALMNMGYVKDLINIKDNVDMTPMHIGAINFDMNIYQTLLSYNPDLTIKDKENKTSKDYLKDNDDIDVPSQFYN